MAEPVDGILPVLKRIQDEIAEGRRDIRALTAKANDIAENILEIKDDVSQIRRDNLMHLGLTAKYRVEFEELRDEVQTLKSRVAALETLS